MKNQEMLPAQPIVYDGRLGEQYKIFLLNVFLGVITLGIYHYWGKTRQRRYTTSGFLLMNDRFEYTGYGIELFWGFIKALVIIGILSIPFFYAFSSMNKITHKMEQLEQKQATAQHAQSLEVPDSKKKTKSKKHSSSDDDVWDKLSSQEQKTFVSASIIVFGYLVFYYAYLPFAAIFGSLRYRVTRTRWRGIRGHMTGSAILYGFIGFFHTLLKIITLGLWIPFADAMTYKYKIKKIFFGSQQASFKPEYGKLFGIHLLTIAIGVLLAAIVGFIVSLLSMHTENIQQATESTEHIAAGLEELQKISSVTALIFILAVIMIFFARFWYRAAFIRMKYNNLSFGDIGFHCTMTGWGLFKQLCGNFFILIFTLGLGLPIVIQRRQKFFCKHVSVTGDIEKSPILQATGEKDKSGEGLSSLFDLNIGLF
ncbi:MAG: hypothetical protein BGO43_14125 [Gammaproteobacteria bacterium 39-13]|nr:DUF898 family protein [Gammaproteobacteria bacterium]OJV89823.1 MAG: hypothetical protein BGO43_14125 [Gammaproteobacteria bacterium 39-13]